MNKAKYLALVYLLPVILYPLKVDHFQDIWIWYYLPFAMFYAAYVWFKPTENITKYIIFTPVAFLVFFIIAFSAQIAFSKGLSAALEFIPVMLLFAVPFGFAAGVIYVLLALLILKGFVKFGLELKNS
ncbi:hypothetical protein [Shewanella fidelis]|uniref:Uncharacterized protein n=1 Tax=Shewanella fidelis TaxID=173509 RepID=A0AAW8NIQ5_9GAMM|nr:hypothetical protein [Shewanella fidelis]MDR8523184.1 hypothetical protein [Shewanella fidelis]MDW4811490.1 hypothetical protein [Shewanella fidelis]MDW4815611.1 hypothetical protein [Shewanella fidelis]MDW4819701.1 hypothetical protein [Shewanella fidelis]MDW4824325.1 hypothetical protein [Shewanella fidelis]